MTSDNKKAKADPAPKAEAPAKDKSTPGEAVAKTGARRSEPQRARGRRIQDRGCRAGRRRAFKLQPGRRPETGERRLQGKLERDLRQKEREKENHQKEEREKEEERQEDEERKENEAIIRAAKCGKEMRLSHRNIDTQMSI